MEGAKQFKVDIAGTDLVIETGLLAQQAAGAVAVSYGDTTVFTAVTNTDTPREGIDFFPLQCEYREKFYAAGKFPGGFFKREARPTSKEILTARMCDRPIRPLFPDGYYNDVQVNGTLIQCDGTREADFLAVNAASAALHISEIPFMGPIGCVRIGRVDGQWVINPTHEQKAKSDIDLLYAGLRGKFLMMEGSASEISDEDFIAALKRAHDDYRCLSFERQKDPELILLPAQGGLSNLYSANRKIIKRNGRYILEVNFNARDILRAASIIKALSGFGSNRKERKEISGVADGLASHANHEDATVEVEADEELIASTIKPADAIHPHNS